MKLSVISTVYNQAQYVSQMIESVLMQETDFEFEFIICEDCSTDDSAIIIQKYANKYSCIKFVSNAENLGLIRNYAQCLEMAQGKYIAGIGGDDFFIHKKKLQMQVDFLEENPDYGLVHTQFDELFMYKKFLQAQYQKNVQKDGHLLKGNAFLKVLTDNTINAVTTCFVKSIIEESGLIQKFKDQVYKIEDLPMYIYISKHYKIGYIDVSTVCYRRNKNSVSHFQSMEECEVYMKYARDISLSFLTEEEKKDPKIIESFYQRDCVSYTYQYFKMGDFKNFNRYYKSLKFKTFERKVMFWVLFFRLSFLFNGR